MTDTVLPTIAVLMTCHQQRDQVLRCIGAAYASDNIQATQLHFYLTDDGSADGTAQAVRRSFPAVKILQGSGTLYWNGGMRLAYEAAARENYDYHLWVNSDLVIRADTVSRLLQIVRGSLAGGHPAMVSGSTVDPETGELTSSGFRIRGPSALMSLQRIVPAACTQQCDTIHGNCLLIPRVIYRAVGNLHAAFTHYLGDIDYGLRARRLGFRVLLAPDVAGTCPALQPVGARYSFAEVIRRLRQPKGVAIHGSAPTFFMPFQEWRSFVREHTGFCWFLPWMTHYLALAKALAWKQRS